MRKESDILIIGGGMTGIMAALSFRKQGKSVILVEKEHFGAGASGKSSGFISPDSELELSSLIKDYGKEKAKKLWQFANHGVELIRDNIKTHNIDCDYQEQSALFVANNKSNIKNIQAEYSARQALGYESTFYDQKDLAKIIGSNGYFAGVRYENTFGINSYAFCQGMKKVLEDMGITIFEKTEIINFDDKGAYSKDFKFIAGKVIFCGDRFIPEVDKKEKNIYHAQTFLSISRPLSPEQIKMIFPKDKLMVWDTDLIYQYYRLTGKGRLLLGGGSLVNTYAGKETKEGQKVFEKLSKYLRRKFPEVNIELEHMSPGLIGVTKDFLPILEQNEKFPNIYYVGAAAGLPWSAAIGEYVADKILDSRSDYDEFFSPERFKTNNILQGILGKKLTFAILHGLKKL